MRQLVNYQIEKAQKSALESLNPLEKSRKELKPKASTGSLSHEKKKVNNYVHLKVEDAPHITKL